MCGSRCAAERKVGDRNVNEFECGNVTDVGVERGNMMAVIDDLTILALRTYGRQGKRSGNFDGRGQGQV